RLKKKARPAEAVPEKKSEAMPKPVPALEKKPDAPAEKKPEAPRDGDKKGEADPELAHLEEQAKDAVARAAKNMKASEDRLAKKDTGDATQQIQRDVLKDLDALIELNRRQEQQQQQNASQAQSQRQQMRIKRQFSRRAQNQGQAEEIPQQAQQAN